jgi:tRNA-dihydrouridine synthase
MKHQLISSPLQGFTDFRFRNALNTYFGGIDTFYAPYVRLNGKLEIKPSYQRDLSPKNNENINLVPQIMTNSADEFLFVANYVQSLGYKELNWNLGCPYPMVTKRGMGSGLISESSRIDDILNRVHQESDIVVSMKMRLGFENNSEILEALPVLNKYPLKSISIHARLGKQLYKGGVDLIGFENCLKETDHTIYYNGDLTSVDVFNDMKNRFPTISNWMIGRGLIANPFLPQMIKDNTTEYPSDYIKTFKRFHEELVNSYSEALSGDKHLIMKMYHYWEYFAIIFEDYKKPLKKIKKAKSLVDYHFAVDEMFNNNR